MRTIADATLDEVNMESNHIGHNESFVVRWWKTQGFTLIVLQTLSLLAFLRLLAITRQTEKAGNRAEVIITSIGDSVVVTDRQGRVEFMNRPAEQMLGCPATDVYGLPFDQAFPIYNEDNGEPSSNPVTRVMQEKCIVTLESHTLLHNRRGEKIPIEDSAAPIISRQGNALDGVVLVFHDMSERHAMLRELTLRNARFSMIFEQSGIGIVYCEPHSTTIVEVNDAMVQFLKAGSKQDLVGRKMSVFYSDAMNLSSQISTAQQGVVMLESDVQLVDCEHQMRWYHQTSSYLEDPKIGIESQLIFVFWDINDRVQLQQRLEYASSRDNLTGLANRFMFKCSVENALKIAALTPRPFSVVLIDVDNFKTVNDTKGHHVGDSLLKEMATRLQRCVREYDIVARLGGDEFVLLLGDTDLETGAVIGSKILTMLEEPMTPEDGLPLQISASIGVSAYPLHGTDYHTLLRRADMAMYHAKTSGKHRLALYDSQMEITHLLSLKLEHDLKEALAQNQFELHLQPKIDLISGLVEGAEVLIRWNHPQRGFILPIDFIPAAEQSLLITPIGRWVARETTRLLAWLQTLPGRETMTLSFNVSPLQLTDGNDFAHVLAQAIEEHGVSPDRLIMELTESALSTSSAWKTALDVHQLGVHLSLDDFGTGYSSLSLLQKLPLSELKIDRSFTRDFLVDDTDDTLVRAIIGLGSDLGLKVVAEGVESAIQAETLLTYGCNTGQGYYYARPMPIEDFLAYLDNL